MKKALVDVNHLKKGMFVSELDRPWIRSSFMFQGFRITTHIEIEQLKATCEYVYVDREKSLVAVPRQAIYRPGFSGKNDKGDSNPRITYKAPFEKELPRATNTYYEASFAIKNFMSKAQLGTSLNIKEVSSHISKLTDSVVRHPDALMLLSSIKHVGDEAVHHALHVCVLSLILGRYLGLDDKQLTELGIGALLHDIGETVIPPELLAKKGELTTAETSVIHSHTNHGVKILQKIKGIPKSALYIARDHHERANGSGYPNKLLNSRLDLFTKIVIIADVYDTATSGHHGSAPMSTSTALKKFYELRGSHFDSGLVEKFIQCLGIYPIGSVVEFKSGEAGIVISADPKTRLSPSVLMVRDQKQRPIARPKVVNLASFHKERDKELFKINGVIKPEKYNINVRNYVVNDLKQSLSA